MKAITFKNTCCNLPGWPKDLHLTHSQGYGYALPTHYVYLEFAIDMYAHAAVGRFAPFAKWNAANPILPWYDAYNKTKHHRDNEFAKASLINCIHAVGACLGLFSIRFGPTWWASNFINSPVPDAYRLFRQPAYSGDPRQVYVPLIDFPTGATGWSRGDHSGRVVWKTTAFSL